MRNLAYILILFLPTPALATISLASGSNFSSSTSNSSISDTVVTVWGGVSGDNIHTATTVQDSCTLNGTTHGDCNKRQVGPNVRVQLVFTSDAGINGTAFIEATDDTRLDSETYSSGQTVTLDFPWSAMCAEMNGNRTECDTTGTAEFTFGVESSDGSESDTITLRAYLIATTVHQNCDNMGPTGAINAGIGDYSAFPGDEKIYFPGPNDSQARPEISFCDLADRTESLPEGGDINRVVAFFSTTSMAAVSYTHLTLPTTPYV